MIESAHHDTTRWRQVRLLLPIERLCSQAALKRTRPDEQSAVSGDGEPPSAKRQRPEDGSGRTSALCAIELGPCSGGGGGGGGGASASGSAAATSSRALEDDLGRSGTISRALEDVLGVPRRVRLANALGCSLVALGRHGLACSLLARLLEDMRQCALHRTEHYAGVSADEIVLLRLTCVRAAYGCAEWDSAHQQLRTLCLSSAHNPGTTADLGWGLLASIAGRARQRGYDERWLLRLLMRDPSSALIAAGVAHHCLLSRSYKIAMAEYARLHMRFPTEPLLLLCISVAQMQLVMSRANKARGQSVLLAFGWLAAYSKLREEQVR